MTDEKQEGVDRVTLGAGNSPVIPSPRIESRTSSAVTVDGVRYTKEAAPSGVRNLALGHAITTLSKHIGLDEHHANKVIPLAAKYEDYLINGIKDETHGA